MRTKEEIKLEIDETRKYFYKNLNEYYTDPFSDKMEDFKALMRLSQPYSKRMLQLHDELKFHPVICRTASSLV